MKNNKKRIEELVVKYNNGILTDEEIDELSNLVNIEKTKNEIEDFNTFADDIDMKLIKDNSERDE